MDISHNDNDESSLDELLAGTDADLTSRIVSSASERIDKDDNSFVLPPSALATTPTLATTSTTPSTLATADTKNALAAITTEVADEVTAVWRITQDYDDDDVINATKTATATGQATTTTPKKKRQQRQYSNETKIQVILALETRPNTSLNEIAREFDIPAGTISNWRQKRTEGYKKK